MLDAQSPRAAVGTRAQHANVTAQVDEAALLARIDLATGRPVGRIPRAAAPNAAADGCPLGAAGRDSGHLGDLGDDLDVAVILRINVHHVDDFLAHWAT